MGITLSIYYFTVGETHEDDRFIFDRFLAIRRESELVSDEGDEIVIGESVVVDRGDGTMSAIFAGREGNGRQFMVKIAMNGGTLAVVYLERVDDDAEPIDDVAGPLFRSVVVGPSD